MNRKGIVLVLVAIVLVSGIGLFLKLQKSDVVVTPPTPIETPRSTRTVIGTSVEGRAIEAYTYGDGETHLLFVGGIHGGYEWNSVLLAYSFMEYFEKNPEFVTDNIQITIVPNANPDGLFKVIGKEGRFDPNETPTVEETVPGRTNARGVDLNRNFGCKWQPEAVWKGNPVSAGTAAFSEPEAVAIRDFVVSEKPRAAIFWHSQANAVYASECESGILPETVAIMNTYAAAAQYTPVASFDAYEVTGDAEGWLASIGIPAITVELETHETLEWERNLAGVQAVLNYYAP